MLKERLTTGSNPIRTAREEIETLGFRKVFFLPGTIGLLGGTIVASMMARSRWRQEILQKLSDIEELLMNNEGDRSDE